MTVFVSLMSVHMHIPGTIRLNMTKFFLCMLLVAVAQSSSGGFVICYVLPVLWTMSCGGPVCIVEYLRDTHVDGIGCILS